MFESLVCSALRKEGGHSSESHSRGRPDSTTLMGRDLPPHTYIPIALGGSMHHHGGTLLCSLCQRSSCTTPVGVWGTAHSSEARQAHPSVIPRLRNLKLPYRGSALPLGKCGGGMSGYLAS